MEVVQENTTENAETKEMGIVLDLSNFEQHGILLTIEQANIPNGHLAGVIALQEKLINGRDWEIVKSSNIIERPFEKRPIQFTIPELRALAIMLGRIESLQFPGALAIPLAKLKSRVDDMLAN